MISFQKVNWYDPPTQKYIFHINKIYDDYYSKFNLP